MQNDNPQTTLVLGGGPAGLTAGYLLGKAGRNVVVNCSWNDDTSATTTSLPRKASSESTCWAGSRTDAIDPASPGLPQACCCGRPSA